MHVINAAMRRLSSFIDLRYTAVFLVIAALVGFFLGKWSGLGFWITFFIVAAAILINGWIAAWEDDRPGGFHNPKIDKKDE